MIEMYLKYEFKFYKLFKLFYKNLAFLNLNSVRKYTHFDYDKKLILFHQYNIIYIIYIEML